MDNNNTMDNILDNFVSNKNTIKCIVTWLNRYRKTRANFLRNNKSKNKRIKRAAPDDIFNHSSILLAGNYGVGKTYTVNKIIDILNYTPIFFNFKDIKNIESFMNKRTRNKDITYMLNLNDKSKEKNIVIIDNIESITSQAEINHIIEYIKLNDSLWYYPTILISTQNHNKLLGKIRKIIDPIEFKPPTIPQFTTIIDNITKERNIKINKNVYPKLIKHSQNDIRKLNNIIIDLGKTYNDRINITKINEYIQYTHEKDIDIGLYQATDILINKYDGIDSCLKYYETDKVKVPIMIHEYYINKITSQKQNYNIDIDTISTITKYISEGDIIENYIYGEQNWNLSDLHGIYTCAIPSYYLNQSNNDKSCNIDYSFAQDFNKTSIKKMNKKNIGKINSSTSNNIFDYIYMIKIFKHLIDTDSIDKCAQLLVNTGYKIEDLESMFKVDKINSGKSEPLTSKQKKEIIFYINLISNNNQTSDNNQISCDS